jgi:hypothetical protein
MRDLISVALIVARKIPDLRLVFNALLRRHQLPAARVFLVGAPRPKGVGRARHAEKQDESNNAWRAVQHVVNLSSAKPTRKDSQVCSDAACGRMETGSIFAETQRIQTLRFKVIAIGSFSFRPSPRSGKKRFDARPSTI